MKSGRSGALKPGKLGLDCNANKRSDAGTGDLGVLPTHETSPWLGDAGSNRQVYNATEVLISPSVKLFSPFLIQNSPVSRVPWHE